MKDLWPHQVEAVEAATSALGHGGRASLVAACGTGKTRIGAAAASRLQSRRVLVVVPTIELLVQTLRDYRAAGDGAPGAVVAVCSDPGIADLELLDGEDVTVTTTAQVLAEAVRGRRRVTVLSTYASLPVVADAHAHHCLREWDLAVVDEAHRTTGTADGPWKIVHRDEKVPAARRLYMTATPRVAAGSPEAVASMDDAAVFGEVCYRLPFSRAIDMSLLADYRVVVPVVTDAEIHRLTMDDKLAMRLGASSVSPAHLAGQIAVLRTMAEYGVRRAISYHHRVAGARTWAATLPAAADLMPGGGPKLWAGHVSGAQTPHLRRRILQRLGDPNGELAVVANAKVLNEGVDVPAVDAVVFSQPRRSAIDTVQALGRALRTGGRRDKVATIVVPLLLAQGENPEATLESSTWEPVWQVLRALRDHDDRLDGQLRRQRVALGQGRLFDDTSREVTLPAWLRVDNVDVPDRFARAITITALRSAVPSWEEFYGAACAYVGLHGDADISSDWVTADGRRLGDWWRRQKVAYNSGELSDERVAQLEALGITWRWREENWTRTFDHARVLKQQHGHLLVADDYTTPDGVILANWLNAQRQRRRQGKLPTERITLLDEIDFCWDGVQARWMQRYREVKAVYERRGSLRKLPGASREAIWLEGQVATHRRGHLSAEQIALLGDIGIDVTHDRRDLVWHDSLEALKAFHAEDGHWAIPKDVTTVDGVNLASWVKAQRSRRKSGALTTEQIALLDKIGFPWEPRKALWEQRRAELAAFAAANGHTRLPRGALRSWLYQQKKKHRHGMLDAEATAKLAAVDPLWNTDDSPKPGM